MRGIAPIILGGLLSSAAVAQQAPAPAASVQPAVPAMPEVSTFATAAEVKALIERARASIKPGQTMLGQPVVRLAPYAATLEYRPMPAPPSVHETNAEFIYVISGSGTMTIGGTLVDPKAGGGGNLTGSGISGGTPRKLAAGDMLFVPEGTPHQFSAIAGTMIDLTLKMPRPVPPVAAR